MRKSVCTAFLTVVGALGASSASGQAGNQPGSVPEAGVIEIIHEDALEFLDRSARVTTLAGGYEWTEGPLWIEDGGYLLFSDIPNNVIVKYEPGVGASTYMENSGAAGVYPGDYSSGSNGLLLDGLGRLVIFQQGARRVAVMDASLSSPRANYISLAERFQGRRLNSPNDGVFHGDGSLYFTDPPYGLERGSEDERRELQIQGIYRLGVDGQLELLDDTVRFPNGIGLSPDEETLYVGVSDATNPVWLAYDVLSDGTLGNRRVFFDADEWPDGDGMQGLPDGMAVHSSGAIFASGPGGVWLFSPDGRVLARIHTGQLTSNCTLSADEKRLFITADDTLMSLAVK